MLVNLQAEMVEILALKLGLYHRHLLMQSSFHLKHVIKQARSRGMFDKKTKVIISCSMRSILVASKFDIVEPSNTHMLKLEIRIKGHRVVSEYLRSETEITEISSGCQHTLMYGKGNEALAFGDGKYGQLGSGFRGDILPCRAHCISTPAKIRQISTGNYHSAFLADNGDVYTCGKGDFGQLGLGDTSTALSFQKMPEAADMARVACGAYHTMMIDTTGRLYGTGCNSDGQLGLGDKMHRYRPVVVQGLSTSIVSGVHCGSHHTLAIESCSGKIYTFGYAAEGQLGHNSATSEIYPRRVYGLHLPVESLQSPYIHVTLGSYHTLIYSQDDDVCIGFGRDTEGQLGKISATRHNKIIWTPKVIPRFSNRRICQVVANGNITAFSTKEGYVCITNPHQDYLHFVSS